MKFEICLTLSALLLLWLFHSTAGAEEKHVPFARLADLRIDPDRLEDFRAAATVHAEATLRDEPGALALYAVARKDEPAQVRVLELYTDAAAYQAHLRSPHFRQFRAATDAMTKSRTLLDVSPLLLGAKPSLTSNPIVRTADLEIDPARLDDYRTAVIEEIEASIRLEAGVLAIQAVSLADAPNRIRFLEVYADEEAYRSHIQSPHFKKYAALAQPLIVDRKLVEATVVVLSVKPR